MRRPRKVLWRGQRSRREESELDEQEHFVEMLEELAPLLNELPRGISQEIVGSLMGISRLLRDLDVAKSELERRLALIEAEQIVALGSGDNL